MPELEITIDPQGNSTIQTVDLLEDFWADFLLFRRDAQVSDTNHDKLRTQRYLRVGLFSLLNYLAGLANRWQGLDPSNGLEPRRLSDRFEDLAKTRQGPMPPSQDIDLLGLLASRCADLKPGDEFELSSSLSIDQIEEAERRVIVWLDEFTAKLDLPRHIEPRGRIQSYADAVGKITSWTYQGFDLLADDPKVFQDPPGFWEDQDPTNDPGRGVG